MLATILCLCLPPLGIQIPFPVSCGLPYRAQDLNNDSANPSWIVPSRGPDADRELACCLDDDDGDEGRSDRRADTPAERWTSAAEPFPLFPAGTHPTARAVETTSRPLFCLLCTL